MKLLKQSTTVLLATFSPWLKGRRMPTNGNVEPLLDFFVPKTYRTVLMDQPYPGSDFVMPRVEIYEKGRRLKIAGMSWFVYILYPFLKILKANRTYILYKIRDFLSVVDRVFQDKYVYDLFIGLESINCLAGIILKKLGKIKCVVYYVSDYSPSRYQQKWFNDFYLWLDRYCATHADYIWDVSAAMQPARIKAGLKFEKSASVLRVPNALYPSQIKSAKLSNVIPYSIIFMGTLGPENGPDLAIKSLPYILKSFPQTVLHIVGGGEDDLQRLRNESRELKVKDHVIFHGFIADRNKVSESIRNYAVALAPYVSMPDSPRWYGDATKIRAYLAAGLPIITTQVPPLGREVAGQGAAIIVKDAPRDIAYAVVKLFADQKLLRQMKNRALLFAKNNTWEKVFSHALESMP